MAGGDDIRAAADKADEEARDLMRSAREEELEARRAADAHLAAAREKNIAARGLQKESYRLRYEARSVDAAELAAERATDALQDR